MSLNRHATSLPSGIHWSICSSSHSPACKFTCTQTVESSFLVTTQGCLTELQSYIALLGGNFVVQSSLVVEWF